MPQAALTAVGEGSSRRVRVGITPEGNNRVQAPRSPHPALRTLVLQTRHQLPGTQGDHGRAGVNSRYPPFSLVRCLRCLDRPRSGVSKTSQTVWKRACLQGCVTIFEINANNGNKIVRNIAAL